MTYDFQWDVTKAKMNRRKHGVSFEEAALVFIDPRMRTLYDAEHSAAEDRWVTLGLSAMGRLPVVCHTATEMAGEDPTIRIFSSRKADKEETDLYLE